ncbi:hypothetical protein G6O67_002099 [Ophiocordyceps sinensis]|uniref:Uncharacterized protein n=1 Tax=Ophiocordyceps sinensis TaxID=72228 RepID=A0A8H4PTJ4_9HYPO|nr:hypothetical protein G6O67_002099 [Ophiocordyceps sinensis]
MVCFGQLRGNSLSSYNLLALLNDAGIRDERRVLPLNGIDPFLSLLGALIRARMKHIFGRRPPLLYDMVFCSFCVSFTGTSKLPLCARQPLRRRRQSDHCLHLWHSLILTGVPRTRKHGRYVRMSTLRQACSPIATQAPTL